MLWIVKLLLLLELVLENYRDVICINIVQFNVIKLHYVYIYIKYFYLSKTTKYFWIYNVLSNRVHVYNGQIKILKWSIFNGKIRLK